MCCGCDFASKSRIRRCVVILREYLWDDQRDGEGRYALQCKGEIWAGGYGIGSSSAGRQLRLQACQDGEAKHSRVAAHNMLEYVCEANLHLPFRCFAFFSNNETEGLGACCHGIAVEARMLHRWDIFGRCSRRFGRELGFLERLPGRCQRIFSKSS